MEGAGRVFSEFITGSEGRLQVEEVSAEELAARFGTPLYVLSEQQIRHNYRRFRNAFQRGYDRVQVMYAIKANNNLAVRRILTTEGAGGECFGLGEMWATLAGGCPPEKTVLNGSNKSDEELQFAIDSGVTVNVDNLPELARLESVAAGRQQTVRAAFRVKPEIADLMEVPIGSGGISLGERIVAVKWGMPLDEVAEAVRQAQASRWVRPIGLSFHMGRHSIVPDHYGAAARGLVSFTAQIRDATGFVPELLDLGGGYPHGRDPEGGGKTTGAEPIEAYAGAITAGFRAALKEYGLPDVLLELEPGRSLVGNTGVLLATVGTVKRLPGHRPWVHLNASTNHLLRREISGYKYRAVAANRLAEPAAEEVQLVGPNCTPDIFEAKAPMPSLQTGDLIALLDAGMYAETVANQFNGMPRPATVLVSGRECHLIKRRETIRDVFQLHEVPARLLVGSFGSSSST